MNYSKAVRVARSLADISQGELADRAQIDRSYLSLIESGKRQASVETIEKIAAALDMPFHLLSLLASEEKDIQKANPSQIANLSLALTNLLLQAPADDEPDTKTKQTTSRRGSPKKSTRTGISNRGKTRSAAATR
jgi:transcriptional regulator with XRE-family HTH domain